MANHHNDRESLYPRVLAQRPGGALLVALDAQRGCVYEPCRRVVYPQTGLATLLAQPFWQTYHGDGRMILRDWPGPLPVAPTFPQRPQHDTEKEQQS